MATNRDQFIKVYESLTREVNKRAGQPGMHSFEVMQAAARDPVVRKQERVLRYIRDVRNLLAHPQHQSVGDAVLISDSFLAEVQGVLNRLQRPPMANSVGVTRKQVRTANLSDRLGDLAADMKRFGFSHLPILATDDIVIGVFNEAAVFDHLWAASETIISRDMTVADILQHCRLDADHTETFEFVRPGTTLDDLAERFKALRTPTTRIGAVFVTASGKANEPMQRMITPWDVLAGPLD